MALTEKQRSYAGHRAAGLPQTAAARAAGYAMSSAKVAACRLERSSSIQRAIAAARGSRAKTGGLSYDPEGYLRAVVSGREPANPVRVSAAKALLPFLSPPRRVRKAAALRPRELQQAEERATEQALIDGWNEKVRQIRGRLGRRDG